MYARFAGALPGFVRGTLTSEAARDAVAAGLRDREQRLIDLAERAVYDHPGSPYLQLLRAAGCERGDFAALVRSEGAEGALTRLAGEGVYVTIDELKAKTPIVRGSRTFTATETAFDNPLLAPHLETRTSGSRSAGTRTAYDLAFVERNWSVHQRLLADAYGAADAPYGFWYPVMPGAGVLVLISWTKAGMTPRAWFSPVASSDIRPPLRDRLATSGIVTLGRALGVPWPRPEFVALDDATRIARWIRAQLDESESCLFNTYTSAAVRIAQAARSAGFDLAGAVFVVAGEPLTEAKRAELETAGVKLATLYGSMEAGFLGAPCVQPAACDEVHLLENNFVFGQRTRAVPHADVTVDALLCTGLLAVSPKVLLNAETGDCGVFGRRGCDCSLERAGLGLHFHTIRGFDKLTSQGMTFIGSDLLKVLEHDLPARFGGSIADYQMVEEEDATGHTRMSLVIAPGVGPVDESEVVGVLIEALSRGPHHHRMMARVWADSGTLRVVRDRPKVTASGKLLPLHITRGARPVESGGAPEKP